MKRESGLTVIEVVIAFLIIIIVSFYTYPKYEEFIKLSKETALVQELKVLREGVYFYVLKYNKYPASLKELEQKGFIDFNGQSYTGLIIKKEKKDKNGNFLDPFGNIYIYEKEKGNVRSGTEEYKNE
ncbi:hypothetical protein [Haliovirga abyssi]|uniref:Prepilin-type N-terminal cleavage/methylation domain-containing protein n=1 Tax=Haliovirga abyssi TaxID=2996794 RepID=A0AAU9DMW8_9FUSO|nr:hypothetical protein [Haliovirga abyssi]BDU49663.1 hypothetical protein HLVA_02320 [Haliovirga abyssi]